MSMNNEVIKVCILADNACVHHAYYCVQLSVTENEILQHDAAMNQLKRDDLYIRVIIALHDMYFYH